jgi:hypothetical protein
LVVSIISLIPVNTFLRGSLWLRNIKLGLFSFVLALIGTYWTDGAAV